MTSKIRSLPKSDFLAQLGAQLRVNQKTVGDNFVPLTLNQLGWSPSVNDWNILRCIEHLNLTHVYYRSRIQVALHEPVITSNTSTDIYQPSFWGRIYMHFALNPKSSFPTARDITPVNVLTMQCLNDYLAAWMPWICT